jgi:hypothetical protein
MIGDRLGLGLFPVGFWLDPKESAMSCCWEKYVGKIRF